MRWSILANCLVAALLLNVPVNAADPPSPEESAIRANADKYVEAFNAGDASALAALWSPDAVYVDSDTGEQVEGREAIAQRFAHQFAAGEPRPTLSVAVLSVRLITSEVAMEDGIVTLAMPDGAKQSLSYSAISVRKAGQWLLDSVRETTLPPPPTAFDMLQPLAFLVGQWADQDEESVIHSTYRWSGNGAFLTQTFNVQVGASVELRGTQIIGWDAERQQIRSWLFDSDGGFGEGVWNWNDGRWSVHQSFTLPDGRRGSAINVLRPLDPDTFGWKSTARQVGDELLPNEDEVIVSRVEASSSAPAAADEGTTP
jgi:uncharacterized protein (TIGR02246 family)